MHVCLPIHPHYSFNQSHIPDKTDTAHKVTMCDVMRSRIESGTSAIVTQPTSCQLHFCRGILLTVFAYTTTPTMNAP